MIIIMMNEECFNFVNDMRTKYSFTKCNLNCERLKLPSKRVHCYY